MDKLDELDHCYLLNEFFDTIDETIIKYTVSTMKLYLDYSMDN